MNADVETTFFSTLGMGTRNLEISAPKLKCGAPE